MSSVRVRLFAPILADIAQLVELLSKFYIAPIVKWYNLGFVTQYRLFDSDWEHQISENGETGKLSGLKIRRF